MGQLSADLTNNGVRLTQLRVIFRVKLTDFPVIVDPDGVWPQWTLSGSSLTPAFLECVLQCKLKEMETLIFSVIVLIKSKNNDYFNIKIMLVYYTTTVSEIRAA